MFPTYSWVFLGNEERFSSRGCLSLDFLQSTSLQLSYLTLPWSFSRDSLSLKRRLFRSLPISPHHTIFEQKNIKVSIPWPEKSGFMLKSACWLWCSWLGTEQCEGWYKTVTRLLHSHLYPTFPQKAKGNICSTPRSYLHFLIWSFCSIVVSVFTLLCI